MLHFVVACRVSVCLEIHNANTGEYVGVEIILHIMSGNGVCINSTHAACMYVCPYLMLACMPCCLDMAHAEELDHEELAHGVPVGTVWREADVLEAVGQPLHPGGHGPGAAVLVVRLHHLARRLS